WATKRVKCFAIRPSDRCLRTPKCYEPWVRCPASATEEQEDRSQHQEQPTQHLAPLPLLVVLKLAELQLHRLTPSVLVVPTLLRLCSEGRQTHRCICPDMEEMTDQATKRFSHKLDLLVRWDFWAVEV